MTARWRALELTAPGRGAIRVLELTGPGALERLKSLTGGRSPAPGDFRPLALRDGNGELLDEVIALVRSPERVELHLHGAPALVARVLSELGGEARAPRARSLEQWAEECLESAASEAAARVLLDQVEGALRRELEALLGLPEADLREAARELARRGRVTCQLVSPPRVVLAGPVNAGKSTLFNLLVGRERVLVDAAPGTTRDAVRERVQLGSYAVELYDTAGARGACEEVGGIEQAGQRLARELGRAADLVLWLVPPGHEPPLAPGPRERVLYSRADLNVGILREPALSALRDPERARALVEEVVHAALGLPREPWRSGEGAPFRREWVEALEGDDPCALRSAVRAWLAAGAPAH